MNERPRSPDDLPASNGHTGPAAAAHPPVAATPAPATAPSPAADDRRDTHPAPLAVALASRWAVILKRFRDYVHQR